MIVSRSSGAEHPAAAAAATRSSCAEHSAAAAAATGSYGCRALGSRLSLGSYAVRRCIRCCRLRLRGFRLFLEAPHRTLAGRCVIARPAGCPECAVWCFVIYVIAHPAGCPARFACFTWPPSNCWSAVLSLCLSLSLFYGYGYCWCRSFRVEAHCRSKAANCRAGADGA